jgi:hypothetical protein
LLSLSLSLSLFERSIASSSAYSMVAGWCAVVGGWFSVMRAHNLRNAVVVDSNYSLSMIVVHCVALGAAGIIWLWSAVVRPHWPHCLALQALHVSEVRAVACTVPLVAS